MDITIMYETEIKRLTKERDTLEDENKALRKGVENLIPFMDDVKHADDDSLYLVYTDIMEKEINAILSKDRTK